MKFSIITLFPDMISPFINEGVIARGVKNNILEINTISLRDFAKDERKTVDERPVGGGDGMVIRPDITQSALESIITPDSFVIHLTPAGKKFDHNIAKQLTEKSHIILLSGRYAGFDSRVIEKYSHLNLSIGDFVLSGGELPALCVIDAVSRFVPGVLGNIQSVDNDSFEDGLLEGPIYTKPLNFENMEVPSVLLSGNHEHIAKYKRTEQIRITVKERPDLIEKYWANLTDEEKKFAKSIGFHKEAENVIK